MSISYADVEERNLGKEAKIASLADQKIESDITAQEQSVDTELARQGADQDAKLEQDALRVIEAMNQIQDQGGDPMEEYSKLPPILQNKVSEMLSNQPAEEQGEVNSSPAEEQLEQGGTQSIQPLTNQQPQQQQQLSITDQAKKIAAL